MFRRVLTVGGLLVLSGAVVLSTAGTGWARGGGGFGGAHFGGFHGGVGHYGGYHGGYWGGYHAYGYRGYGNRGYYPGYGYNRSFFYNDGAPLYSGGYPQYYDSYEPSYSDYPYSTNGVYDNTGLGPESAQPEGDVYNAGPVVRPGDFVGTAGYQSFYGPAPARAPAAVTVNVPARADLWFDGAETRATGAVRDFQSPPLTSGQRYSYEVRARWNENGHTVTQTQQVDVRAGARVSVRFPAPPKTSGQAPAVTQR
jgi:uncharacterized protein (TIGR03000 family)